LASFVVVVVVVVVVVTAVCCSGGKEERELINRSKLPKLLEQVKSTFPDSSCKAHTWAKVALGELAKE